MPLTTVVLDLGETLVDETSLWQGWAELLGVPAFTLFGVLGGLAARAEDHRGFVELLDVDTTRTRAWDLTRDDLYPDAEPCLRQLRADGWQVVVGGNQPPELQRLVEQLELPVDAVVSSGDLGVAKPDPGFYEAVAARAGRTTGECVHVGDRVDNDVVGARAAGMTPVHVVRGPWGYLHRDDPAVDRQVRSLAELPALLAGLR